MSIYEWVHHLNSIWFCFMWLMCFYFLNDLILYLVTTDIFDIRHLGMSLLWLWMHGLFIRFRYFLRCWDIWFWTVSLATSRWSSASQLGCRVSERRGRGFRKAQYLGGEFSFCFLYKHSLSTSHLVLIIDCAQYMINVSCWRGNTVVVVAMSVYFFPCQGQNFC